MICLGHGIAKNLRGSCTFEKKEVCKSGMFDLRVDFCHLDLKSRANHLEHFGTLNVTGLGHGIATNLRGSCTLEKQKVCKSGMFDLRVDFCHLNHKSRANHFVHFRTLNVTGLGLGISKNMRGGCILEKHEVCKNDLFDLRVDVCHLNPKSRANKLEHFRSFNVTGLGLGIVIELIGGCTLKFGLIW